MSYKKLVFHEITDTRKQAAHHLDCSWTIQITHDSSEDCHECNLYNGEGGIVDADQGLDEDGVEEFIVKAKELVAEYKELLAASYVEM